mgnify:FL=1
MKYIYLENWLREKKLSSLNHSTKVAVIDNESLTKRLSKKKDNSFRVTLKEQCLVHSKKLSHLHNRMYVSEMGIYRSVRLEAKNFKNIYAESFFPIRSIKGRERYIKILGSKSLGSYLLNAKRFKKSDIFYSIDRDMVHRLIIYRNKSGVIYVDEIFPKDFTNESINLFQARRKRR